MKQRVITAACLLAVALPLLFLGGVFTSILIAIVCFLGTLEYVNNVFEKTDKHYYPMCGLFFVLTMVDVLFPQYDFILSGLLVIVLFYFNVTDENFNISKISYLYMVYRMLSMGMICFDKARAIDLSVVFYILITTYLNDAMAQIGGMMFGKRKLNTRISPNKTIEGCIIGYLSGAIVGMIFAFVFTPLPKSLIIPASIVMPLISQLGDLAFSSIKRYFQIKDFSNIFPGHGGMLDRIDSLIFALITFVLFLGI